MAAVSPSARLGGKAGADGGAASSVGLSAAGELLARAVGAGASRQVAAAVAAALWRCVMLPVECVDAADADDGRQVDERLAAIKPCVAAQVAAAGNKGVECHSARGLVSRDVLVRANAAKHHRFGADFSLMSAADCRRAQRGARRRGVAATLKETQEVVFTVEPEPVVVPMVPKVPEIRGLDGSDPKVLPLGIVSEAGFGVPRTLEEARECIWAVAYGGLPEEAVRDVLDLLNDVFVDADDCEACSDLLAAAAMDMQGWGETYTGHRPVWPSGLAECD